MANQETVRTHETDGAPLTAPSTGEMFVRHVAGIQNASSAEVIDLVSKDFRNSSERWARIYDLSQMVLRNVLSEIYRGEITKHNSTGINTADPLFEQSVVIGQEALVRAGSNWKPGISTNFAGHVREHIIEAYREAGLPLPDASKNNDES